MHEIFGITAGILGFLALIPYIRAILRHETYPQRTSWVIWSVVGIIIAASYQASGAEETVWLAWVFVINTLVILALSVRYGTGGRTKLDLFCLGGALLSLIFWFVYGNPQTTFIICLCLDFLAALPTIKRAWYNSKAENLTSWVMITFASVINLFAVDQFTFEIASYPVYGVLSCASVVWLLMGKPLYNHFVRTFQRCCRLCRSDCQNLPETSNSPCKASPTRS
jgi:hypothetical protein